MFVAFVKHFEICGQKGGVRVVVSSKREKAVKLSFEEVILIFLCLFPLSNILSFGKKLLVANN